MYCDVHAYNPSLIIVLLDGNSETKFILMQTALRVRCTLQKWAATSVRRHGLWGYRTPRGCAL